MLATIQRNSLMGMVVGMLIWSSYFVFAYAFVSLACGSAFWTREVGGVQLIHGALWIVTALVLVVLIGLALGAWRQQRQLLAQVRSHPAEDPLAIDRRRCFMAQTALWLHGLAIIALAWVASPVLLRIPPCL